MLDDTSLAYLAAIERGDQAEAAHLGRILDTADTLDQQHHTSQDLRASALAYAAQGIAVFPIKPRGKQPLTAHGFKDATTDVHTITAWWTATPNANIGVPTGHTFDVIDIDSTAGLAALYNGDQPIVDELTVLGVTRTSRPGGRHLYVPAAGHGNKTNVWPGVDYRGTGGYVVTAPSIGSNGQPYRWVQPLATAQAAAA